MKSINTRKKLKGTVLFTVVSVMMVMIVFVMVALTIASAASKRSYNTYFKNQALYSARSIVDSTVEGLLEDESGKNNLKNAVGALGVGSSMNLDVVAYNEDDGSYSSTDQLPNGMGQINALTVECVAIDGNGSGQVFVAGTGAGIIKVTAEVEMGGQISTYSQYVLRSSIKTTPAVPEGGLVAMGSMPGIADTNIEIYGTSYIFNSDQEDIPDISDPNYKSYIDGLEWSMLKNEASINDLNFNTSLHINTKLNVTLTEGHGMTIAGHLQIDNQPEFQSIAGENLNYNEIPYIYVGGAFYKNSDSAITIGSADHPINIYSGTFNKSSLLTIYGDVYAYDVYTPDDPATPANEQFYNLDEGVTVEKGVSYMGDSSGTTALLNWIDGIVSEDDAQFKDSVGGSFYSNGNLIIDGKANVQGDVIVKGDVNITTYTTGSEEVNIGGSLYVGGNLTITQNALDRLIVKGGIFCGGTITVDGVAKTVDDLKNQFGVDTTKNSQNKTKYDIFKEKVDANKQYPKTMDRSYLFDGDTKTITANSEIYKNYLDDDGEYINYKSDKTALEEMGSSKTTIEDLKTSGEVETYTQSDYPSVIEGNCILSGSFSNKTIYIDPGDQTLWIILDGITLDNNSEIIVENLKYDADGNVVGTLDGKVCFFVPEGKDLNLGSTATKVVTTYYRDVTGTLELSTYPSDKAKIPNIYIYMAGGTDPKGVKDLEDSEFITSSGTLVTAFIYAPYAEFAWYDKGLDVGSVSSIRYEITDDGIAGNGQVIGTKASVIGQVIVGNVNAFQNDNVVIQISPNASNPDDDDEDESYTTGGDWTKIENGYSFGS